MGGRFAPQNGRCETHLRPPAGANCIRRPVVPVNEENVYVLQLLDLLKNLDVYLDESDDVAHDKVSQFVRIHGITKNDVDSYIREFPIAIFKYYYELRLDDAFA